MKKVITIVLALTLAMSSFAFAAPKKTYVDGTYKATYDAFDKFGWKPQASITIKGDKITAATFDSVNNAGKLKTQDANYNDAMKKGTPTKTYPALYSPQLAKSLVKVQDVSKVDVVSSATESSNQFKALATAALANAKKGVKTQAVLKLK